VSYNEEEKTERTERLQFFLTAEELAEIEEFRIPTRAAAVGELLRRGLRSNPGRSFSN